MLPIHSSRYAPRRFRALRHALPAAALATLPLFLQACAHETSGERLPLPTAQKPTREQVISRIKSAPIPPEAKEAALRKFDETHPSGASR